MSRKNTGGPAFMVAELANIKHDGMTLRDYFAAHAMQGMLAEDASGYTFDSLAQCSYAMADAMLKARVNRPSPKSHQPKEITK